MYTKYTADWYESAFLVLHLNIAVFMSLWMRLGWRKPFVGYLANKKQTKTVCFFNEMKSLISLNLASLREMKAEPSWNDTLCRCGWKFCTHSFVGFLYKHSLVTKTEREPQGGEKGSAEHQNKVRQSLVIHSKTHQATSGIMRGLSLMCESRVCPLCESKWGETREEGVVIHLKCSHSVM